MDDLYDILGVAPVAAAVEMKAAYRERAKSAHPDKGGDRAAFERLREAYEVLSDPLRRAHYDATGEIVGKAADNTQVPALATLTAAFDAVIAGIVQRGQDPKKADIIGLIRKHIEAAIESRAHERVGAERQRPQWEDLRGRFSAVDGKPNLLATIVDARIARIERLVQEYDNVDAAARAALEILDHHRYRFDTVQEDLWMRLQMPSGVRSTPSSSGFFTNSAT